MDACFDTEGDFRFFDTGCFALYASTTNGVAGAKCGLSLLKAERSMVLGVWLERSAELA